MNFQKGKGQKKKVRCLTQLLALQQGLHCSFGLGVGLGSPNPLGDRIPRSREDRSKSLLPIVWEKPSSAKLFSLPVFLWLGPLQTDRLH